MNGLFAVSSQRQSTAILFYLKNMLGKITRQAGLAGGQVDQSPILSPLVSQNRKQ